jgi:hypothetical protein
MSNSLKNLPVFFKKGNQNLPAVFLILLFKKLEAVLHKVMTLRPSIVDPLRPVAVSRMFGCLPPHSRLLVR